MGNRVIFKGRGVREKDEKGWERIRNIRMEWENNRQWRRNKKMKRSGGEKYTPATHFQHLRPHSFLSC